MWNPSIWNVNPLLCIKNAKHDQTYYYYYNHNNIYVTCQNVWEELSIKEVTVVSTRFLMKSNFQCFPKTLGDTQNDSVRCEKYLSLIRPLNHKHMPWSGESVKCLVHSSKFSRIVDTKCLMFPMTTLTYGQVLQLFR